MLAESPLYDILSVVVGVSVKFDHDADASRVVLRCQNLRQTNRCTAGIGDGVDCVHSPLGCEALM